MLPKFLLFREVRLGLERARITVLTRSQCNEGHPISTHTLTNARCRDPLRGGLEGDDQTFTIQGWGNLHNVIGGSQHNHEA